MTDTFEELVNDAQNVLRGKQRALQSAQRAEVKAMDDLSAIVSARIHSIAGEARAEGDLELMDRARTHAGYVQAARAIVDSSEQRQMLLVTLDFIHECGVSMETEVGDDEASADAATDVPQDQRVAAS